MDIYLQTLILNFSVGRLSEGYLQDGKKIGPLNLLMLLAGC